MEEFRNNHTHKFHQLTDREKQVLKLLAEGLNNREIADKLYISRSTVETHRKNLKKKLEINNYKDILQYALAFELIKF